MTSYRKALLLGALGLALSWAGLAGPVRGAVTVLGSNLAHACFVAAKFGGSSFDGVDLCTRSIDNEPLDRHDLAGTYINRGVLYMHLNAFKAAQRDFEHAQQVAPDIGEGAVNFGGALIAQHRWADGIAAITRGLSLGSEEPEKAYYNRALGYEGLGDVKAAYFDYLKASQLKPDWAPPKTELSRFSVSRAP
jgi:tetratricopeptide (TPR) repeat protein